MISGHRTAARAFPRTATLAAALALGSLDPSLAAADPGALDGARRAEVIDAIAGLLEQRYVHADVAAEVATELRRALAEGRYEALDSPQDLAGALTRDLQAHDRHFLVTWSPPGSGEPAPGDHSDEARRRWELYSRLNNRGFETVARLPGNLGYLDLRFFDDPAVAGDAALAAMTLLSDADAVVVDLRHNGGGEPGMVQLLISWFLPPRVRYNGLYWRAADTTEQLWTLPHLSVGRRTDVPLYVLTAARTGSAAEAFAYSLQALDRATIVGEPTAGAANPGEGFDLVHGFAMFVSTGAAVNPVTGTSWEGVGVRPDVAVPSDEALDVARLAALELLLDSADSPTQRREVGWALDAERARRRPIRLAPEALAAYPATYGTRVVRRRGAALTYQRGRRPERSMVPLGDDVFLVDGLTGFRTRFERDGDGRVVRMVDMWTDGHEEASARE